MKTKLTCDYCGKEIERCPSQVKRHNFCSRECLGKYSSKSQNPKGYRELKDFTKNSIRFSENNASWNKTRMTPEVKEKLRAARLIDPECRKSYSKLFGKHTHRVVAEQKLGRPLRPGEVVHHIDGDKQNNSPENLQIFKSQSEHAKIHALQDKGGEAR